MKPHYISLDKAGHFSELFLDYINQKKRISPFYQYSPVIHSFEQALQDISSQKFNRQLLVEVLKEQYTTSHIQNPPSNIQLLLNKNTFTVCTGHQLCLFTGPLYFIYKIISTINLAEALQKKYPSFHFVPIFWLLGEDHDFKEVNHIELSGKKLEWKSKQRGAVGRFSTRDIGSVIDELENVLGESENAQALITLFRNAYGNNPDLISATRYLVSELFGKYGLVILDADNGRLKNEFKEIIRDDIFNRTNFRIVNETIAQLKKIGYEVQVLPKEINFFILSAQYRARIEKAMVDAQPKTWQYRIETETGRFSPNVVTRTLYQQKILPNIAYVGGPAEIAYWLQYKAMFEHHQFFFPVLIPRNFVFLANEISSGEKDFFSGGEQQERQDNFIPYYVQHGEKFLETLKNVFNPFDFRLMILTA